MSAMAAVVLAPSLDDYPPLRVVREAELSVHRVEPCACGGSVVQIAPDEDVSMLVRGHNATPIHQSFRRVLEATR